LMMKTADGIIDPTCPRILHQTTTTNNQKNSPELLLFFKIQHQSRTADAEYEWRHGGALLCFVDSLLFLSPKGTDTVAVLNPVYSKEERVPYKVWKYNTTPSNPPRKRKKKDGNSRWEIALDVKEDHERPQSSSRDRQTLSLSSIWK
jgi:hypothetical protein